MRSFLSWLFLAACTGCASAPDATPRELLNQSNGSTLIVVRTPMVFSRPRTDVAANVRDYATVVALQEDRAGNYANWLVVHRWSTVDPRMDADSAGFTGRVIMVADGRVLSFEPQPAAALLERGELLFAPASHFRSYAYRVDLPTLRYIAIGRELSLRFADDVLPVSYAVWEDGRRELQGLLDAAVQR